MATEASPGQDVVAGGDNSSWESFLLQVNNTGTHSYHNQCCGSESVLDPYSGALWIRILIPNTDQDPHM